MLASHADLPFLRSYCRRPTTQVPWAFAVVLYRWQVFWLASHPPGAFPVLKTSGIVPFVVAYSGGSAGELHPSSLSSPCGHHDSVCKTGATHLETGIASVPWPAPQKKRSACVLAPHADLPFLRSYCRRPTTQIPWAFAVVLYRWQVFWLASRPPGAFPVLKTSGIVPFVVAYSGGSAGDLHPSSLSSPFGHHDFICDTCLMQWHMSHL